MKYLIALFFLHPGATWDTKVLEIKFTDEAVCERIAEQFDGKLNDGTLVIHNCIKDDNG